MPNEILPNTNAEVVLYQPNENIQLDVRISNDTVWLTRQQMATLFGRDVKTIGKHINNALREELAVSVVAKNAITAPASPTVANNTLIKSATTEVILIDGYVGADTFHILETRASGVQASIYTDSVGPRIQSLQTDHEREYGTSRHIDVRKYRTDFHDRFLIIDEDVYHFGASLKDLGKRLFAFDKMGLSKNLILSQV